MTNYPTHSLQLNLNVKNYNWDDPVLAIANDANLQSVPKLWGVPLKYISLVTLAVQNSALAIIMHYSRISTSPSQTYSAATAVLLNELLKGFISLAIAFYRVDPTPGNADLDGPFPRLPNSRWSPRAIAARFAKLGREVFGHDCWKLSIPAILYVIQNNLQFVAASNLDAATFQVSYQMKILTTAVFSVLLLRKKLLPSQWIALLCLAIGVGIVQIQSSQDTKISQTVVHEMHAIKGFLAVAAACFTSGLAGVYFEMVLKNSSGDLWVRNVQLSLFSLLPALVPVFFTSQSGFTPGGYAWFSKIFENFGAWAWATVAVQVMGGLITALVIKYSDNILKGFATSLSIVISFLASVALFNLQITFTFILGSGIVLVATWLYNCQPKPKRGRTFSWGWGEKGRAEVSTPTTPCEISTRLPVLRSSSYSSDSLPSPPLSTSSSLLELSTIGADGKNLYSR